MDLSHSKIGETPRTLVRIWMVGALAGDVCEWKLQQGAVQDLVTPDREDEVREDEVRDVADHLCQTVPEEIRSF